MNATKRVNRSSIALRLREKCPGLAWWEIGWAVVYPDTAALVLEGPRREFHRARLAGIARYWHRKGREWRSEIRSRGA